MKFYIFKAVFVATLAGTLFVSTRAVAQTDSIHFPSSTDSTYGYTKHNPIYLKKGGPVRSIRNTYAFLEGLRTYDNQVLKFLYHVTVADPSYQQPKVKLRNIYTGRPLGGKTGLLDGFVLVTATTQDTVILYVDTERKGEVKIPIGLKYELLNK